VYVFESLLHSKTAGECVSTATTYSE
jgi:hypothetical protein